MVFIWVCLLYHNMVKCKFLHGESMLLVSHPRMGEYMLVMPVYKLCNFMFNILLSSFIWINKNILLGFISRNLSQLLSNLFGWFIKMGVIKGEKDVYKMQLSKGWVVINEEWSIVSQLYLQQNIGIQCFTDQCIVIDTCTCCRL